LVRKNAVDIGIRALQSVPQAHFAVLGEGPEEENLRFLAEELGLQERVHFLGNVPYEALPAYLHGSDIFLRPSRSEGMGNSFIEAMAAGLPVIATQVGGIADFLFDPVRNPERAPTGFAVDADDVSQVAQAIERIRSTPDLVARVKEHAARMVTERYDWNIIAADMRKRVFNKI